MNRRIRNRLYGGVGGRREQSRLLPDETDYDQERLTRQPAAAAESRNDDARIAIYTQHRCQNSSGEIVQSNTYDCYRV